jgi:hypothetical protein
MTQETTEVLILATFLIWIIYDIFAYLKGGNAYTESWQLWKWGYYAPGFCVLFGILLGHLFFSFTPPNVLAVPCMKESKK